MAINCPIHEAEQHGSDMERALGSRPDLPPIGCTTLNEYVQLSYLIRLLGFWISKISSFQFEFLRKGMEKFTNMNRISQPNS